MSRCLADRGVDHVVLERGRLGERWRTARWDSFRLITPAWMTRLPGHTYQGDGPDGYWSVPDLLSYLDGYARSFTAALHEMTTVTRVSQDGDGYVVVTDRGGWRCSNVVIATGYHSRPVIPAAAAGLPGELVQVNPASYRRPDLLPDGGVLAVGSHTALPRRYRDHDILWWLDRIGSLDRTIDDAPDAAEARREPSFQLAGSPRPVDLHALQRRGVRLAGRLLSARSGEVCFADDLAATTQAATARMIRVLSGIDRYAGRGGPNIAMPPVDVRSAPARLELGRADVRTVVWATGFRPAYPWLDVPVLDGTGQIRHHRGITAAPGLCAIGLRFQYRRNATFIDGARHDASFLADHIATRRTLAVSCTDATSGRDGKP
jgi:putative flavoprotein involved in K+ transport